MENKSKLEILEQQKKDIVTEEKEKLKEEVEAINQKLDEKSISFEEADRLKEEAAKKHALNIENRLAIVDNKIALLNRNEDVDVEDDKTFIVSIKSGKEEEEKKKRDYYLDKRTTSTIVVAAGFNNALADGQSLDDSDFKIGGSRFFEIGWSWKTRVFNNSNWLRFKYGVSFQFNGLKPTDNRYFVEDGNLTRLEEFDLDFDKSKFRMDNLVFPVHFEMGPSRRFERESGTTFSTYKKFKIGLGGYAGFNIGERQKLKYKMDGDRVKEKLKSDYNTNDFIYGLSGYVGWGGTSLYVKYDLNPIFDDPNPDLNNISLGLRFDLD
ncbi:hypothetical protein GCM10023115_42890 [Pontixanthobacter gangjinensis]